MQRGSESSESDKIDDYNVLLIDLFKSYVSTMRYDDFKVFKEDFSKDTGFELLVKNLKVFLSTSNLVVQNGSDIQVNISNITLQKEIDFLNQYKNILKSIEGKKGAGYTVIRNFGKSLFGNNSNNTNYVIKAGDKKIVNLAKSIDAKKWGEVIKGFAIFAVFFEHTSSLFDAWSSKTNDQIYAEYMKYGLLDFIMIMGDLDRSNFDNNNPSQLTTGFINYLDSITANDLNKLILESL